MKLSALVSVGPIQRMSYQYNAKLALENYATYFDNIYVVSSSRETQSLPIESNKILFFSDENYWMPLKADGKEGMNFNQFWVNTDRIHKLAQENGDDFLMYVDINQYIDEENANKLREYCRRLKKRNKPFGYKYKAFQIIDKITYPDKRHPWLLNVNHRAFSTIRMHVDSIYYGNNINVRSQNGFWTNPPFYVTDILPPFMNKMEFLEKFDFYIKYVNLWYRNEEGIPDYELHSNNILKKINSQVANPHAKLSFWGKRALENIPKDSVLYEWDINLSKINPRLKSLVSKYINLKSKINKIRSIIKYS